jgi:hypothetical protein
MKSNTYILYSLFYDIHIGSTEYIPFEKYSSRDSYSCLDVSLLNGVSRIGLNWQGLEEFRTNLIDK